VDGAVVISPLMVRFTAPKKGKRRSFHWEPSR
jgi:hypothetical protein